jgi:DNA polymerase-3 subunit epsilon
MDFIAIDFETTDIKNRVPCSLGISLVKNNAINKTFSYLINPEMQISPCATKIHGITNQMVSQSPTFPLIWEQIKELVQHYPIVAHNAPFDISVLEKAAKRYNIDLPNLTFYCTLELYKVNYPELKHYSLNELCDNFNITLENHHCCSDDSCAAAQLMIKLASDESTIIFGHAKEKYRRRSENDYIEGNITQKHNIFEIPVYEEAHTIYDKVEKINFEGAKFVITGDFKNYSRAEIKKIIEEKGGICNDYVSPKTDYLIVAYQNINVIKNTADIKSKKLMKAEEIRDSGGKIKIISDEDFIDIINDKKALGDV